MMVLCGVSLVVGLPAAYEYHSTSAAEPTGFERGANIGTRSGPFSVALGHLVSTRSGIRWALAFELREPAKGDFVQTDRR